MVRKDGIQNEEKTDADTDTDRDAEWGKIIFFWLKYFFYRGRNRYRNRKTKTQRALKADGKKVYC